MSASALPGWDNPFEYISVEQAAVVLQDNTRPTTIYIDRGCNVPLLPSTGVPAKKNGDGDDSSEDDFS